MFKSVREGGTTAASLANAEISALIPTSLSEEEIAALEKELARANEAYRTMDETEVQDLMFIYQGQHDALNILLESDRAADPSDVAGRPPVIFSAVQQRQQDVRAQYPRRQDIHDRIGALLDILKSPDIRHKLSAGLRESLNEDEAILAAGAAADAAPAAKP